jgi:hypothetical protein
MSTYSIHSPVHGRTTATAARDAGIAAAIAVGLVILLVVIAFLATAPATTSSVRHIGHGAISATTGDTGSAGVQVVSNGAVPRPSASGTQPTRAWRETLRGRALGAGRAPASALLRPTATGQ